MKSKCLILGDIHLGKSADKGKPAERGSLPSRIQDQINLLDWAYNLCEHDESIRTIVITGDVYQAFSPHPAIIGIFMRWLKKCEHLGISIHIVMGNHDIIRSGQYVVSALDLVSELKLENAKVYKNVDSIQVGDFTIVLVPFRDKRMYDVKTTEEALKKLHDEISSVTTVTNGQIKVCVGHLAIEGCLSIDDELSDQLNEIFVPPEMFDWFDYVWMGHIHHPQVIQYQNPYVAHIGSLDRSDFSKTETETDKIAILLDSEAENKFQTFTLPTRNLRSVKIDVPSGKNSTEFTINELCLISKTIPFDGSIVRLEIRLGPDSENVDREKVCSYILNNLEAYHICDFSETRALSSIEINPDDSFDNTMEISQTINKWAETRDHFEDEQERELFKISAGLVYKKYEEKYLK